MTAALQPAPDAAPPAQPPPGPGRDLDSRAQVHDLVVHFYREIVFDPVLAPVFDEVAEVDWAVHLPRLTDYWCRVLLGQPGYDGLLLPAHQRIHDLQAFEPSLFDRWYGLWSTCIDDRWAGPNAESAKTHAARVMAVLARRLCGLDWAGA